jgi:hypothetical protein
MHGNSALITLRQDDPRPLFRWAVVPADGESLLRPISKSTFSPTDEPE